MIVPGFSTAAVALVLASHVLAEPIRRPYKASTAARMSVRQVLALSPRATDGYTPADQACGAGDTCNVACGPNYQTCASNDGQTHCFDPSAKQTCCPGGKGDACDAGFFCSADAKGATWCCPDSMTLEQCAKAYNLPGALTSEVAPTNTPPPPVVAPTPSNDIGLPISTTQTAGPVSPPAGSPGGGSPPPPAQTTSTSPAAAAPTSQILVETSASFGPGGNGGSHSSSCVTLTSEIVQTIVTSEEPSVTAPPPPPPAATLPSTTSTIIIPAPTVRPSVSSTVPVFAPTSSVPIAAANSRWPRSEGGAVLVAVALVAAVLV
ncbi:hypothetical protein Micbo1qcDRAFT_204193 [Microdochium bolleyi]|uniref:Uncharacterized protein n=1 Tax=Microdochium bolleyi TaxID=196109 RepID=A0A136J4U1_9PEZI|nr:hypothetical protein Micbo1qcDRAFT_204193 [Microdochium bolleyi]